MPLILFILMLLGTGRAVWSAPAAAATPANPSLPVSVRDTLNQEYPGWTLAPVTAEVRQEFKKRRLGPLPSLTTGDFDLDGKKDFAVQIVLKTPGQEEQIIIVYLYRGGIYEETILQSMGIDPSFYLWVAKRPIDETGAHPDKPITKDVLMVLGGPAGDTVYSFDEGRFHEIALPDDSEAPDATIPRIPNSPQAPAPE